jgi:hypothetical protein
MVFIIYGCPVVEKIKFLLASIKIPSVLILKAQSETLFRKFVPGFR